MQPYFEGDGIRIYHGDCRDVLAQLPKPCIDLVLTDPPYGVSFVSARRARRTGAEPIANDESLDCVRETLPLCADLLKDDRHFYYFASMDETLGEAVACLPESIKFRRLLVWDKGSMGMGDLKEDYGQQCEAIIYAAKGRLPLYGGRPTNLLRFDRGGTSWDHPTQKPVPLCSFLIGKSTQPGQIVLDPFMGSGTTLVAAKGLGRKAIGVECEEKYCELAARRLDEKGTWSPVSHTYFGRKGYNEARLPLVESN